MRAIVYISQETQPFNSEDLRSLLEAAISANRRQNVTGYLHYHSGNFLQYIEGETAALYETMDHIARDNRHKIFYRAEDELLEKRRFPEWYMGCEDRDGSTIFETAISGLTRELRPFERLSTNEKLERTFSLYKQIAYDHTLRGLAALKSENDDLSNTLSMAVHDLRGPVRTISYLSEMYVEDAGDKIDPEYLDMSQYIHSSLDRMHSLVDGILDHFNTDTQIGTEWVDTGAVVDEIASTIQIADKGGNLVKVGEFPTLQLNSLAIWRVLNCLVTNALKYNQSKSPRVEISVEKEELNWQFCVKDNGIGIDPKYQRRIFEIFQRLHTQSAYPGAGVGLATCRKLVKEWNGNIWVSSREGEGSRFYFTCPAIKSNRSIVTAVI